MANYDKNFTDELRTRLSIVDVVSKRVPLTKKGQNYWGCCPFHNEKTPSFSVNEDKGFYHCFGCGEHGDIISFTMKSENVGFVDAIKELADMAGHSIIATPTEFKPRDPAVVQREESYFDITERAAAEYQKQLFTPAGAVALEYIRGRGFTDEMIKKYRLGYAPKNNLIANKFVNTKQDVLIGTGLCRRGDYGMYDFFRDKLMFPIFSARGQVVAFSGRSLDGSEPKYINTADTEIFHKRKTIFGFNFARESIHRNNRTIIVEGQIDAIQMQCHGFPETVAPLGTALTEDHLAILCKANRNIVFCFDGDTAGQKAATRAANLILPFIRDNSDIKFAFVTGGKDPDEILKKSGKDAMDTIINNATGLTDFIWDIANKNYIVSTPGGRAQAEKFLKSQTDKITDISLRAEYENEYNSRKFNQWHKWSRKSNAPEIAVPEIDAITRNTLVFITNKYPEIAERYAEFLATLNISLDGDAPALNLDAVAAEKYIVSLKLQKYLERLRNEQKELTVAALGGDAAASEKLATINSEIARITDKQDQLISM